MTSEKQISRSEALSLGLAALGAMGSAWAIYQITESHQLGYGVRFYDEDGSFRSFVQVMMEAAAEVA